MSNPDMAPIGSAAPQIRPVTSEDIPALKAIIDANQLFQAEMLDGMLAGYLTGSATGDRWITYDDGGPTALAYFAPEQLTQGTWNLLLIAVRPDRQGQGRGTELMDHVEQELAVAGERLLLVETSGLPDFARTRAFYRKLGYVEEARIRDFYDQGEDKIIFRKELGIPSTRDA